MSSFCGVKRRDPEANHSRPSSAEVRNEGSYIFSSPFTFMEYREAADLYLYRRRLRGRRREFGILVTVFGLLRIRSQRTSFSHRISDEAFCV